MAKSLFCDTDGDGGKMFQNGTFGDRGSFETSVPFFRKGENKWRQ